MFGRRREIGLESRFIPDIQETDVARSDKATAASIPRIGTCVISNILTAPCADNEPGPKVMLLHIAQRGFHRRLGHAMEHGQERKRREVRSPKFNSRSSTTGDNAVR